MISFPKDAFAIHFAGPLSAADLSSDGSKVRVAYQVFQALYYL
jgi:hypothetical protein